MKIFARAYCLGGWFTFIALALGASAATATAVGVGAAGILGAGVNLYEGNKATTAANKALDAQQKLVQSATYTPINVQQLQQQATQASIQNATNSLALQRQLQPGVAASNDALQKSVAEGVKAGGNLTPDEQSQVASAARIAGGTSGAVGGVGPYTAALTGQSANALLQQRQGAAEQLAAANPAPSVGLSASDLASSSIANTNAQNSFNLMKLGAQSNLINSQAQVTAAGAGQQGAAIGSAVNGLTGALALSQLYKTPTTATPTSSTPAVPSTGYPTQVSPGVYSGGYGGFV